MKCRSEKCQSSNVQLLATYWASLPSDSPLKKSLAQPAAVPAQYLGAAAVAAVGLVAVISGALLGGLLVLGVGLLWGSSMHRKAEAAESDRAAWGSKVRCLACTETWVP